MIKRLLFYFSLVIFTLPTAAFTVQEAIKETIQKNPDIYVADQDRKAIEEALTQARAAYLPKVKLNLGYGIEKTKNSSTISSGNGPVVTLPRREMSVSVNQTLFDGFATKEEVARNRARVYSAAYKTITTIQDVMQRSIEVYISVLRFEELVKLAEENLTFHQKIARMIGLRTESGVGRAADFFQAKGRLSLAESNLLAERSNLKDAQANFYRTIGISADRLKPPSGPESIYLPVSLEQAIDLGIRNNPLIKSAEFDIHAAIAQHQAAKSSNYPKLEVQLGASQDRNIGGTRGPSEAQFAMLRMSYTLFNGGADRGRQQETAHQEQQAKEIRRRAIQELIEAIKLTWHALTTAESQTKWLKAHQDDAEKTVIAYQKQFEVGQRLLLDLLDGENELFAAKRAYVNGRYEILLTKYRILKDLGLLLVLPDFKPLLMRADRWGAKGIALLEESPVMQTASFTGVTQEPLQKNIETKTALAGIDTVKTKEISKEQKNLGKWVVQLGVFKNQINVKRVLEKLTAEKFVVNTKEIKTNKGIFTHVYAGAESDQIAAKQLAEKIKKQLAFQGIVRYLADS